MAATGTSRRHPLTPDPRRNRPAHFAAPSRREIFILPKIPRFQQKTPRHPPGRSFSNGLSEVAVRRRQIDFDDFCQGVSLAKNTSQAAVVQAGEKSPRQVRGSACGPLLKGPSEAGSFGRLSRTFVFDSLSAPASAGARFTAGKARANTRSHKSRWRRGRRRSRVRQW